MIISKGVFIAFIKRFFDIKKGNIIFIGNTLGLSKFNNLNQAGLQGSIGAFTSLNTSLKINDFPFGTTLDYTKNSSSAILTLPSNSSILYAELIWGGLYKSSVNNISSLINVPVSFTTPSTTQNITPDTITAQNFSILINNINLGFYKRSANVTNLIQNAGKCNSKNCINKQFKTKYFSNVTKSVDKSSAIKGDTLTYTSTITNTGT